MAKQKVQLDYYPVASGGIHTFMMCATEYLVSRLVVDHGAKIHYYAFLTGSFDEESIDDVTALLGGEELDLIQDGFPLAGLNSAKDKVSGSKVSIVQGAKDAIWEFKKVTKHPSYLGVINAFNYDYGRRPSLMSCPFVVAYDMDEAVVLITCLREAVRVYNRKTKRVLDTNGTRIENFRKMSWDKIFLPGNMLQDIRQEVKSFFESKEMYESHGLDWRRGMLFVGPPGNGKTAIARAIATTSDVPVVYCLLSDGDPYSMLSSAHTTIVRNSPCIAIFEDADSFGADTGVRSSMLNMLDGLVSSSGVLTIASTNCPDKLDSAITGRPSRFDSMYVFENPGQAERVRILSDRLGKDAKRLAKDIESVARKSAGLSSAAVQEIAVCALLSSIKSKRGVSVSDLACALAKVKKHMQCSKDGMDKYSKGSIGFSADSYDGGQVFPSDDQGI